ncbi:hypothetical protein EPUS_08500 [Endocarpon pusillum Z07020]|uniref:Uncharacterized protein n=1 Tax=Endocarpon pusillum (strain Z07020 / HMAS-L-300199) TaxID=1263415 RepID=U1HGU7_ENDPU|nr:uncharacterized protein EPUS_08500 [Endocarpon pusillum Z07020]ERF68064.1 hypothetical protein EPUS_08500 [Endocarpon pusillum Z07020]
MGSTAPFEPIAVVGLSLRLPGGANDLDGLWKLLEGGEPAWTPVPADRYNEEAFYHPNADDPNGTSNHPGGHFISGDIRDFDHAFFQISKSQAAAIDPQQRLLMELAYEALENGGISRESIAGTSTSVFTAIFPTDYNGHLYRDPLDLPVYYMTGVETAIFSNRLSHVLDLRGPSMTLDTACSGGLVALHQACQSLRGGESDAALVAASNLILGPDHFIGLSNLHLLSSTGRCYPFDERGKGYGRGEGIAMLVWKRLDDAIRDRDPVRVVIRSTVIGQDGYTPQNITYPNGQAQADLVRTAYACAGLRPEDVAYVEAHGTGTKAGDKEELQGIADVFASTTDRAVPLYVGSIKGAIGHTEAAAGLAGLLKATVMLDRELIPPVAGFANPKPGLPLDRMSIPTTMIPWPHAVGITPRISINSFGFGGANAHAILERGPRPLPKTSAHDAAFPRLFTLSANSAASMKAMIQAQHDWVEQRAETPLADLSYTLLHRRSALPYRFSAVAEDRASLLKALSQGFATPAIKPSPTELDIVMVFTGQGAHLPSIHPCVTRHPPPARRYLLNEAELAQPATTAIQIALLALLRAQGVRPRAVVGHSSGEIAAACAAGHLSHSTAIKVAFHRGCMAAAVKTKGLGPGAMLSVGLSEDEAARYVKGLALGNAMIACINSPRSVTISGDADAVNEVDERIAAVDDNIFRRKLLVNTAYHSHHMRAVADDYRARLGVLRVENRAAVADEEVAFFSSVTGQLKTSGFGAEYWIANFVSPVRFRDAAQALGKARHQAGQQTLFVEIGPHAALAGPVRQCLQHPDMPKSPFVYHAPLQRKVSAVVSTLTLAGKLLELGVRIHWNAVSAMVPGADTAMVRHDLPAYRWDHSTKHWHESRVARAYRLREEPYHDLLGVPVLDATDIEPRWRHFLSHAVMPWLADHVVDGLTVFPGAGYVCMAIEGVAQLARRRYLQRPLEMVALHDVSFKRGLVVPDTHRVELQLSLRPQYRSDLAFYFSITALSDSGEWYEHAIGVVEGVLSEDDVKTETTKEALPKLPLGSDTVPKDTLYRQMDAVGNTYGPAFAGLHSITMAADASQASSSFEILDIQASMPAKHQRPHVIHPSTLDIVFQTALPLVGRRLGPGSIMPVHVDELLIAATPSLQTPGSGLDISTLLTSSHFRTAVSDISALASGQRVLSVSGMEFRSLGSHPRGAKDTAGTVNRTREICYELDWQTGIDYVRAEDLPANLALTDLIAQITFRRHGQSVIGLGVSVDLSEEFLNAVQTHNKVNSHDFVDITPGRFDDAAERLKGLPVQFRTLRPGTNPVVRGFETGTYDVVLAASANWLNQAAVLVKPGGTIILVLSGRNSKDSAWRATLQRTPTPLEEQLTFRDNSQDRLIVMAKPASIHLPAKIHILTHSTCNTPAWVSAVENGLRARNVNVLLDTLSSSTVQCLLSRGAIGRSSNDTVIVADDVPNLPILTDANTFNAAITLLRQPARLVWLSPDDPAPFHQIEGVARTAHAENDDLRLTTIHAASGLLTNRSGHERLVDLVVGAISQAADPNMPHTEREYRIRENGAVLVPRLHYSDKLNRAIADDGDSGPETEGHYFTDSQRPLVLSSEGKALFVDDDKVYATLPADDIIDVEVQAAVLSKAGSAAPMGEYAGVVARVGANVKTLDLGDRVVALAPIVGASRLRIPHTNAGRIPFNMPSTTASALLLSAMAAAYALRGVARLLSSGGTVLVHGARTPAGRAAIALARYIDVRVAVTAADPAEARLLKEQVGIDAPDVLVARRSLHRRSARDIFADGFDAVIQAGEDALPAEALAHIKPFGSVIVVGHSSSAVVTPKLPLNVAFHLVDITSLVQARPDLTPTLVAEATAALKHVPLSGLEIPVRDVAEVAEALRLINTGVLGKVALQVGSDSIVQVIPAAKPDTWANENATYVIAGGLGDIGQRFLVQMAQRGAKHLATISRRTVDPDSQHALQIKLEAIRPGIRLYILKGDVSSERSVQAAAATLSHLGAPPVRGVIQAATFMNDRPLELTTYDDFTSVTKIKVDGTLALHRAFASSELTFFLSLSSVSSIVGASAEASYNAGNALQDALAHQGKQHSGKTRFLTINFGWIDDAVLTMNDETRQGALRRAGFSLFSARELTRFFDYILGAATDPNSSLSQAIIGFDTESLASATAYNGTIHSALFSQVRDLRRDIGVTPVEEGSGVEASAGSWQTFEQMISDGNTEAVTDFISCAVRAQLARLISVDAGSIDAHQGSIMALGLDSLVAVELRNWVMRQFDAPLQSTEILANQTVHTLAEKIATRSKKVKCVAA